MPEEPKPEEPKAGSCEAKHNLCARCGATMELVKSKWACPKCHWIIGCRD
jgi:ribosomal protein S27AE